MQQFLKINLQFFAGEKTEEATPRRKEDARKKGQVAKSTDLNAAFIILMGIFAVMWLKDGLMQDLLNYLQVYFRTTIKENLTTGNLGAIAIASAWQFFKFTAPFLGVAFSTALVTNIAQVGFALSPEAIKPRFDQLSPAQGFKKIFSKRALFDLVKSLLKVFFVGWTAYAVLKGKINNFLYALSIPLQDGLKIVADTAFNILLWSVTVFLILSIIDYIFQRRQFAESIKMSKQEVKEEFKQTEGDPHLKQKLRERQRQMAFSRMIRDVPKAQVVITNPTHLAIALRYEKGMDAPIVLAKGADVMAEKIKTMAKEHGIPLMENKPVAQALYKSVEVGDRIPVELYQAVAEILAALYRKTRKI